MSRLRSARGTDGDVGQKERGSAGAVLLPERWGCLAAAPPALEPDRFPSPPPHPPPRVSFQFPCVAPGAEPVCLWLSRHGCGSVLPGGLGRPSVGCGEAVGGVGAAGRPHFVRWGVRNWSRCEPPCAAGGSRGRVAEMRCGSPSTAASLCGPHLKIHMVLLGTAPPRNGLTPCSAYSRTPPCCGVWGAAPYGAPGADVPPLPCRAPLPPPEALPTPQAQPQRCTQCPHIPLPHSICAPRTALIPPP